MYLDYTAYDIYGPKTTGAWGTGTSILGTIGSDGDDGLDGTDGKSVLNGTGAPDDVTDGVDGDFYIDTAAIDIYGPKTAGAWGTGVSLVGPPGTDGDDGLDGTDGNTVLSGSGAPSGGLGVDGDFYIDTAALAFYGPKASGSWGSPSSIVGVTDAASDGKSYIRKDAAWVELVRFYDIGVFIAGAPEDAELVLQLTAVRAFSLPAALTESYGSAVTASTGTVAFSLRKNDTEFGTLTFTASGTGVFAAASATSFALGDVLTILAPATADATLADISINLKGSVV
jgi:hypothetical protein